METVGERIQKCRKERGLTQKQFGEKCGILEPNIRKYELGKQKPKIETLEKIANALNVNIKFFLDLEFIKSELDDIFTSMYVSENETRKLAQKFILEGLEQLNTEGMNELVNYLKELLDNELLLSNFYNNDKLKSLVNKSKQY